METFVGKSFWKFSPGGWFQIPQPPSVKYIHISWGTILGRWVRFGNFTDEERKSTLTV